MAMIRHCQTCFESCLVRENVGTRVTLQCDQDQDRIKNVHPRLELRMFTLG